jgi:hypothetical protein
MKGFSFREHLKNKDIQTSYVSRGVRPTIGEEEILVNMTPILSGYEQQ